MTPKADDTFIGQPGAILDGSSIIGGWQQSGSAWSAGGITAHGDEHGECAAATPNCAYPEDAFVDGTLQTRVSSVADLGPGTFYIDYAGQKLWLGSNPTGHLVELATLPAAFTGTAPSVTLSGLIVQKYASPAQSGAINGGAANGWVVSDVVADHNHGSGIIVGDHGIVRDCQTDDNGQQGLGGVGSDVLIDGCEIAGNNTAGYSTGWSAGGAKFGQTVNLVVENSFIHNNHGPGLWTDESAENTTYSSNLVENNDGEGIFEEISYGARITGNTVVDNGRSGANWVFGAGIQIASSSDAEVDHNYLSGNPNSIIGSQQARGSGLEGPHVLQGLWVHDNVVVNGGQVGVADDSGSTAAYTSRNNRFQNNTYPTAQQFGWMNLGGLTLEQWRAYGEDIAGS